MNYLQQMRDPRRRLAVVAAVVVLHIIMIYGWFNLRLYGGAHWEPRLVHVQIVHDVPIQPALRPAKPHA